MIGPDGIWVPDAAQQGPDQLVASARADLFDNHGDLADTLSSTSPGNIKGEGAAMTGSGTAPSNESEQLLSTMPGVTGTVTEEWHRCMKDMRAAEPLTYEQVNPAP